jgi:hypothetical protein
VVVDNRWDEKAGLRTGCGVRSQVIDVLKAQIKRRPAMKKVSTVVAKPSKKISQQKLTVGLDLGDRNSWYCVLDESGQIQREQRVRTNAKALREVFGGDQPQSGQRIRGGSDSAGFFSSTSRSKTTDFVVSATTEPLLTPLIGSLAVAFA